MGPAHAQGGVMRSNDRQGNCKGTSFRLGRGLIVVTMLIFCVSGILYAKVAAGISGLVTDSSGAAVSGAIIQVKAVETGLVQIRQSNSDGFYAFVDLPP